MICALFVFGCDALTQKALTPTDTLRTFIQASEEKDVETIKKTLSKGTINIIEGTAKAQKITVDELLKRENGIPLKEMPETRNEKIEGDAASVEIKNVITGGFDRVPFVKEDGVWKIQLDVFMRDMQKKMKEGMKENVKIPSVEDNPQSKIRERDSNAPPAAETSKESQAN